MGVVAAPASNTGHQSTHRQQKDKRDKRRACTNSVFDKQQRSTAIAARLLAYVASFLKTKLASAVAHGDGSHLPRQAAVTLTAASGIGVTSAQKEIRIYAKCVSGEDMEERRQRTAFQDWTHQQLRGRGRRVAVCWSGRRIGHECALPWQAEGAREHAGRELRPWLTHNEK
jgi:hypothetical protein